MTSTVNRYRKIFTYINGYVPLPFSFHNYTIKEYLISGEMEYLCGHDGELPFLEAAGEKNLFVTGDNDWDRALLFRLERDIKNQKNILHLEVHELERLSEVDMMCTSKVLRTIQFVVKDKFIKDKLMPKLERLYDIWLAQQKCDEADKQKNVAYAALRDAIKADMDFDKIKW